MSSDLRNFSPKRFARLDTAMWQAYYQHNFFRLFILLWQLCYQYTRPNPILTLRVAYHSARAATVFRKTKGQENLPEIEKHLEKFYGLISAHNIVPFNYKEAAQLELEWWMIDRYPEHYEKTRATALAEAMAAIYTVSPEKLREYGEKREAAMLLLGRHHFDKKHVPDWAKIESLLTEGYKSMYKAVQPASDTFR